MQTIELFLDKSVEQNAAVYYEKAKKARKKVEGAQKALDKTKMQLVALQKEKDNVIQSLVEKEERRKTQRKKEWYEKFRWFFTSEGFLCIGGRDATSNEIVIKKHTEKNDWVLHTDMSGSPFFVIKNGQNATEQSILEAAQAVASYSKAWKAGISTIDVFYVKPGQVSKKAQSGEFMPKGSFMITGETKYIHPLLEVAVGNAEDRVIGGAVGAVKAQTDSYVLLVPGRDKTSDVAKKIRHRIGGELDDITLFVPAGGCSVRK
jgi:predicted ribosome quality control (RQC) complex YloA/Tae2 family protein